MFTSSLTSARRRALATVALACLPAPVPALAGDAGAWTAQITKQEARPLGSPDHLLVAQVAQGTSKGASTAGKFEGAQILLSETVVLDKGNGPQNGLLSLVDAKGSKTVAYTGRITTTMVDGQPRTSGKGTWTFASGTGAYADDRNTGSYGFTMTSPTDIAGEWREDDKPMTTSR